MCMNRYLCLSSSSTLRFFRDDLNSFCDLNSEVNILYFCVLVASLSNESVLCLLWLLRSSTMCGGGVCSGNVSLLLFVFENLPPFEFNLILCGLQYLLVFLDVARCHYDAESWMSCFVVIHSIIRTRNRRRRRCIAGLTHSNMPRKHRFLGLVAMLCLLESLKENVGSKSTKTTNREHTHCLQRNRSLLRADMNSGDHQWEVGGLCEMISQGKWTKADIIDVFEDDEGKWVKVKCGRNTLELSPKDPFLRPYGGAPVKIECNDCFQISAHKYLQIKGSIHSMFTEQDLDEIESKMASRPRPIGWTQIVECVKHEMYPMLSSAVKRIIHDKDPKVVEEGDISEEGMDAVIKSLKTKRRIGTQEIKYFQGLVRRARDYRDHQC